MISFYSNASSFQKGVDKLINQVDPAINIGIEVVDLNTGEKLYERNASRAFIPASNMKLFSDAAALMVLGPDYQFQSQLSTNAPLLEDGVLHGSLFLHLTGDPSLTQVHLASLLSQLNKWGIKHIQGDVVLVSSHRHINPYAPGWMIDDLKYSYGAPLAPLMIDENRLLVTVNPSYKSGVPALIELSDQNPSINLNNQVKTNQTAGSCGIDFNMNDDNKLTVRGCVGIGQWAVQQRIAIRNPLRYAQELIKDQLAQLKIGLTGKVVLGNSTGDTLLLATHNSKPVAQILADTLKPSDNLYADSLYLHAAEKIHGTPLNWQEAQAVIKSFLQTQTGVNLQSAMLIDGSGLSRYDLLTPKQTVGLLRFLHDRFPLAYEYIAALPVAGHDGTLQKRFRKPTQQGLVRAKTGTMTGVVSLSGYLYTANGHTLAFAIFINGMPGTSPKVSGRYRYLIDALCDYFLQQKPNQTIFSMLKNPHERVAYQQNPTQAERQRAKKAKWRHLESALKQAFKGEALSVLYRGEALQINDHTNDANKVGSILQSLRKKYAFAVALHTHSAPSAQFKLPKLLWVKTNKEEQNFRTWTLQESVT